ncbi:hypothetical protein TrRE_jg10372 [Triparma retinervis]|uniref:Ceramidase n=1 Tax=Triparma retinervis TaxID=2557542 RepID=A0A9W7ASE0_9STRA|nr:hypothetical protein TrRE_jg10372 [Triparma retinervis]
MAQPITSLSNLGFTFTGLIVLQFAILDLYHNGLHNLLFNRDVGTMRQGHFIASHPVLSLCLSYLLGFMCYTSFCWHASLTVKGGKMDMGSIYVLCTYLIGLCAARLLTFVNFRSPALLALMVHGVNFGALYLGYKMYKRNKEEGIDDWKMFTIYLILGVVGGAPIPLFIGWGRMGKNLVLGWWRGEEWKKSQEEIRAARGATRRRSWGLALAALLCIAFGGAFRQYDQTWMCTSWFGPSHWFQAHAMWHVMCAFAILLLYFFFRSEIFFFNTEKFGGREENGVNQGVQPATGYAAKGLYTLEDLLE